MDGSASGAMAAHDRAGRFTAGNTEYRAKQLRIAERLAQLVADYDTSPSQVALLAIVARHLDDAERCRSAYARTRASNAARRLLTDIPRKQPHVKTFEEYAAEYAAKREREAAT